MDWKILPQSFPTANIKVSLKSLFFCPLQGMLIRMDGKVIKMLADIEAFLAGTNKVGVEIPDRQIFHQPHQFRSG
jgi:hypothetical protein